MPSSSEAHRLALAPPSAELADADPPTRIVIALPMVTAMVPAGPVVLVGPLGSAGVPVDVSPDAAEDAGINTSFDVAHGDWIPCAS